MTSEKTKAGAETLRIIVYIMGFLGLFGLKLFDPNVFEKELSSIAQEISRTRNKMTVLGKRRRTLRKNIISYPVILYLSWIIYRYNVASYNLGPLHSGHSRLGIFFRGQLNLDLARIAAIPVLIAVISFLVNWFFRYLIEGQNKKLDTLVNKHKSKIEELKKLSNYNTTNLLLEKYGDKPSKPGRVQNIKKPSIPPPKQKMEKVKASVPNDANKKKTEQSSRPVPDVKPTKSIQDRLLDYIIGSDHNESIESRYALICANCYTHNGLAPPGSTNPLQTTYICRNCGFINGLNVGESTNSINSSPPEKTFAVTRELAVAGDSVLNEVAQEKSEGEAALKQTTNVDQTIGSECAKPKEGATGSDEFSST